eukprot:TRINITY_DN43140_c0_g1_i1.p1 TRINITY_DN43140_c0_g1~~TRINITY_DN43140_c0_g1_i1.p1  ORF type:complete len:316 (-),score=80.23 TRINITY_DN43140_c0_g1_i1:158-1105(-)
MNTGGCCFFFFKQKTAYEMLRSLVGSEMCIRDRVSTQSTGKSHHPDMATSAAIADTLAMPLLPASLGEAEFWDFALSIGASSLYSYMFAMAWFTLVEAVLKRYTDHQPIQTKPPRASFTWGVALLNLLLNVLATLAVMALCWPWLRTRIDMDPHRTPPVHVFLFTILFSLYLDDFVFYWVHRALHLPAIYPYIHKKHHTNFIVRAPAAYYMTATEFVMDAAVAFTGPLLVRSHVSVISVYMFVWSWQSVEAHCGYELPWWAQPSHLLPFSGGPTFHDFHHSRNDGNYAALFEWTDRVFGTVSKHYAAQTQQVKQS